MASLVAGLLALVTAGAAGIPATGPETGSTESTGTISGVLRSGHGTTGVEDRLVEIVDVESGERHRVTTDKAGGFTVRVKPGTYLLQVALLSGESLVDQPGPLRVQPDAPQARADLVIGTVRMSRPRPPVYQPAMGLGAPVA